MEVLTSISVVSFVMWYIIDRIKPLWAGVAYGKYITTAVSAAFAAALSFGYGLDIMQELGIVADVSWPGMAITTLALMSESSAVAELIQKMKA